MPCRIRNATRHAAGLGYMLVFRRVRGYVFCGRLEVIFACRHLNWLMKMGCVCDGILSPVKSDECLVQNKSIFDLFLTNTINP